MPFLPPLFYLVSQWRNPTLPEIPKPNTFPGLPVELLLSIADFLARNDVTCTSLCNRRLFVIFHRNDPMLTGRDKLPFLTRLGRDLPSCFICYKCNVLHRYYASKDFIPGLQFKRPLRCLRRSIEFDLPLTHTWNLDWVSYHFNFLHLQLAMRRFYHGPEYGIITEDIFYTQVRLYSLQSESDTQIPFFCSVDAQICSTSPSLILRVQQTVSVPRHKRYLLYRCSHPLMKRALSPPHNMSICKHRSSQNLDNLINGIVGAHCAGEKAPFVSVTCDGCDTEALVEVFDHENELALVLTKWISLGAGLTPDDPQWQKHQDWRCATMTFNSPDKRGEGRVSAVKASARAGFESASLDRLRSLNIAHLKDQRFKKSMIYEPNEFWGPTWVLRSKQC